MEKSIAVERVESKCSEDENDDKQWKFWKAYRKVKFLFVVCREGVGGNSVICQFYSCWVQKKCGIRGKLKEDIEFKSQTFGN